MRRVVVGGSTASGKSMFARELAERLRVPLIDMDELHWGPQWTETPADVFRAQVDAATCGTAWVVDGNYSVTRDLTWDRADTLVWLDYSFGVVLWRLIRRTNRRILSRAPLWNGNRERFASAYLSVDSLYVWLLRSFWRRRRTWPRLLALPQYAGLVVHRFRTPSQAQRWLETAMPLPGARI